MAVGRLRRTKITRREADWYTGETDAHQALEYVVEAARLSVNVLLEYKPADTQSACLDALTQARAWLRTANLGALDRTTRWVVYLRLRAYVGLIDTWAVAHGDEPRAAAATQIFRAFSRLESLLYAPGDHLLRLNAHGLLPDQDLRRQLQEIDRDPLPTREVVDGYIREAQAGITRFPT